MRAVKDILLYYCPRIDTALNEILAIPPSEELNYLYESMKYSVMAGGKRLRPILSLLSYLSLNKKEEEKYIPLLCSLELAHTYSLIHDDLPSMDNDDLRRGKATNHKVFGEGNAILAGDGLLTLAFENIVRSGWKAGLKDRCILNIIICFSEAIGPDGMVGGQSMDLASENKIINDLDVIKSIHLNKTAKFLSAASVIGGLIGDANEEQLEALRKYGEKIGLAFQIIDDILDLIGDEKTIGKPIKSDINKNKATYPSIAGLDESRKLASIEIQQAKQALTLLPGDTGDLVSLADFILERSK
ncbi:MAG: polyprenyl synthetase family protein [Candidatus Coatesbacteria bacterium]|nr:polyprenyl synthetase family protein [Candidatus Coatesbacteria bacterium]